MPVIHNITINLDYSLLYKIKRFQFLLDIYEALHFPLLIHHTSIEIYTLQTNFSKYYLSFQNENCGL